MPSAITQGRYFAAVVGHARHAREASRFVADVAVKRKRASTVSRRSRAVATLQTFRAYCPVGELERIRGVGKLAAEPHDGKIWPAQGKWSEVGVANCGSKP
jgi:hypothetical protein